MELSPYCKVDCLAESYADVPSRCASVESALRRIMTQAEELLPKVEDIPEKMGDLVDEEMLHTTRAIEQAAAKIAVSPFIDSVLSLMTFVCKQLLFCSDITEI